MTEPTRTLEPPALPAPLMSDTPKKRQDLAEVGRMLREGQERGEEDPDDEEDLPQPDPPAPVAGAQPALDSFGAPEWFNMPKGGLPEDVAPGTTVVFMRFPVWITGNPQKGERQCAVRPLTVKLEKFARAKAKNGESYDLAEEYARAAICVVDGVRPELFKAGLGSVNHFWDEVGPKARELLLFHFNKLNRLSTKERDDFLSSCVAVRTAG